MRCVVGVVAWSTVLFAACTAPNPRSCKDGLCTDQAFPFCDVDGSFDGTPMTCIAVACTPMEFAQCRGDQALICNSAGNDYEQTTCPDGCDEAVNGCVVPAMGCQSSADCTLAGMPFCDPTNQTCRKCQLNSECSSDLCDVPSGQCVAEGDITYAAPNGQTGTCGTRSAPCTLTAAWSHMDASHHVIKLAAGAYSAGGLTVPNTATTVYGQGATISTATGPTITLAGAATLRIDGVKFFSAETNDFFLTGAGGGAAASSITLDNVEIHAANIWLLTGCAMTADRSTFVWTVGLPGPGVSIDSNSELTLRHSIVMNAGLKILSNARLHVSNSLFRDTQYTAISIINPNGGTSDVSFSTFFNSPLDQNLSAPAVVVSNSILSGSGFSPNAITGNAFTVHYSLLTPQSSAPAGSDHTILNMDPKFVSPPAGDFHLMSDSSAVGAADPLATLADDFDGVMRPQGSGRDLGAFEYKP